MTRGTGSRPRRPWSPWSSTRCPCRRPDAIALAVLVPRTLGWERGTGQACGRWLTTRPAPHFSRPWPRPASRYVFANLGSDHPGLIEAFAQAQARGPGGRPPELIVCPHEMVAHVGRARLRHGDRRAAGRHRARRCAAPQNLGGDVSNAMRGRVPGAHLRRRRRRTRSDGELPGGRNEFIQWIQDVRDQRGILRNYVKYDNEIRTGRNVKQLLHRALQIARSEPRAGLPDGAREVMEEPLEPYAVDPADFGAVAPGALSPDGDGGDRDRARRRRAPADRDLVSRPRPLGGAVPGRRSRNCSLSRWSRRWRTTSTSRSTTRCTRGSSTTAWRRTRSWRRPT